MKIRVKRNLMCAIASALLISCGPKVQPDPLRGIYMLTRDPNPVPLPNRVQIFSSLKEADRDRFYTARPPRKAWLRLETTNEATIRSLVAAMRENAMESVRSPLGNAKVVTYHIYFQASDSQRPLYYMFYYQAETNQPSSLTAYSTAGNLCNAEGVEHWFAANNLLPAISNTR